MKSVDGRPRRGQHLLWKMRKDKWADFGRHLVPVGTDTSEQTRLDLRKDGDHETASSRRDDIVVRERGEMKRKATTAHPPEEREREKEQEEMLQKGW